MLSALEVDEHLSPDEFHWLSAFFENRTGIALKGDKEALVRGRLLSRARALGHSSLSTYVGFARSGAGLDEQAAIVDVLTTHETSFFREPSHFEVLRQFASSHPKPLRVWSAACSTGEEAASIAMTLAEVDPSLSFEVVGTDIAPETIRRAQQNLFPMERATQLSPERLRRHCLRGTREAEGTFRLQPALAARLHFEMANLLELPASLGRFDVIFLRNVLIYFNDTRRRQVVKGVLQHLKPRGLLLPGHAEHVRDVTPELKAVTVAVFRYEPTP